MRTTDSSGFSLVEMLIAMSILLMVLFIGSFAYNQYSQFWVREVGNFEKNLENAKSVRFLYHVIHNIRPHMIKGGNDKWFHYFEGGNTLLRSVTSEAVSSPEHAAIFELALEEIDGVESLVYREQVIDKEPFISQSQISEYSFTQVLNIEFEQFLLEFKGWKHVDDFYSAQENRTQFRESWFGFYSGQDTLVTPSIVKLTFVSSDGESQIFIPLAHFIPEHLQFYSQGGE